MALAEHCVTGHAPTYLRCDLTCAQALAPELLQELKTLVSPGHARVCHRPSLKRIPLLHGAALSRVRQALSAEVRIAPRSFVCCGDEPIKRADLYTRLSDQDGARQVVTPEEAWL